MEGFAEQYRLTCVDLEQQGIQFLSRYQQAKMDQEMSQYRKENRQLRNQLDDLSFCPQRTDRLQQDLIAAQQRTNAAYEEYLSAQLCKKFDELPINGGLDRYYIKGAFALRASRARANYEVALRAEKEVERAYMQQLQREYEAIQTEEAASLEEAEPCAA